MQLVIERVIVGEDTLEIRHVIPLGRLGRSRRTGATDPGRVRRGEGPEPEGWPRGNPSDGLRSDGVELAELVGHAGQGLGHGLADRCLAVGDHPGDRHRQGPLDLERSARPGRLAGGGEQAPGQEDLAGEDIAHDPEDLVADVGLEPIDGQDHAPGLGGEATQPGRIGQRGASSSS